ncbi:MAG: pirin family protein [Oligoflexus sp.]
MEARKKHRKHGFQVVGPEHQADGSFDQGKVVEKKMIGFSGEGSLINQIGPLYYFAWAKAEKVASIPEHPHRGFEIISYVLEGELTHSDSLGKKTRLRTGDLQIMHTGSGMEHEEIFVSPPISMLQIWLDPNFREEIKHAPHYQFASAQSFQDKVMVEGWFRRSLAGGEAMLELEAPVVMEEWNMAANQSYHWHKPGYNLAALVIKGSGEVESSLAGELATFQGGDFVVFEDELDSTISFHVQQKTRIIVFEILAELPYRLFPKP